MEGNKMKLSRRTFLKNTTKIGLAASFPTIISSCALSRKGRIAPSDRVNIGIISCGNRSGVTLDYKEYPKSQVIAVCDPVKERRLKRKKQFGNCADYSDFRELLVREDVDAVHISTADHWHVPISLAAARAGKDMYTEKPLGISVEQCLAAREIANKHKRIFQYGTQNRSMIQVKMGIELVLNGHIGDVKELYVWCPPGESGGSMTPELPVPEGFDYDLWLGPAPEAPFCKDRCLTQTHRNGIFHIYDYAIGFIAGWGAHPVDQLQWWADNVGLKMPVTYEGTGTIPKTGLFNTLTNWDMTCTYENGLKLKFLDDTTARKEKKIPGIEDMKFSHGTLFVGEKGWIAVSRSSWKVFPESLYKKGKSPGDIRLIASKNHRHDFIDAVLKRRKPISDLESAVRSDIICHLSDISIRTGRKITWDPVQETIVDDAEANRMMSRPMREPWTL
ncbi:Gfo/Idh/MocA family oxidoreductase [candidate division KSB1 bacterium]|nr:Gfo/Idh/MocA family oxidoreductase [candidate division KSB1 bacterium]MBL7094601.1 Gfo/Idh/MocA family oxidoreductase [candidate division KSB1 bacterium]